MIMAEKEIIEGKETKTQTENRMGTDPIGKLLISLSTPMMISMMVQALYNIVDSIFVAMLSEDALTAVSLAFPIQNLMISFGVGTGVGVNALVSRHLGGKRYRHANSVVANGIRLSLCTALVFAVLVALVCRPFFQVQTNDPLIISYGVTYTTIIGILGIGMFGQTMFEKLLQATGKTFFSMITQIVGAVTNIIMDPILIFGIGPFPKLGVAGAAIATIFGQILGTSLAIFFNLRYNKEIRISFKKYPFSMETIASIYGIGIPSIFMSAVGSIMTFGLNKILVSFSSTAVAVFGVYFKLQSFTFMPVFGLNNGLMPLVSYNFGARKPKRIMEAIKLGLTASISIMLICFTMFQLIPVQLLGLFSASENMIEIGVPALRIISFSFLLAGFSVISMSVFQALGHAFFSLIISVSRQLLVLLPLAYALSLLGNIDFVWLAFPIAEAFCVVLCLIFVKYTLDKEVRPLYELEASNG